MVPCKRVAQVKNSSVQKFVETRVWTRMWLPRLFAGEAAVTLWNVGCFLKLEESCKSTFSVDFLRLARALRDLDKLRCARLFFSLGIRIRSTCSKVYVFCSPISETDNF